MKHGTKTQIAKATGKSTSFICQYFKGLKRMSWDTAVKASEAYPQVKPELWMNQKLTKINQILNKKAA